MDKVADIVEAVKFFPSKPGRLVVRLLRHLDPVLTIYTESDPLTYGDVDIKLEGVAASNHAELVRMLTVVPRGRALCIEAYPREDLNGWVTKAFFTVCDLEEDKIPPMGGTGTVDDLIKHLDMNHSDMVGDASHWQLPSQSGTRLVKKPGRQPRVPPATPVDPESIHHVPPTDPDFPIPPKPEVPNGNEVG